MKCDLMRKPKYRLDFLLRLFYFPIKMHGTTKSKVFHLRKITVCLISLYSQKLLKQIILLKGSVIIGFLN